MEDVREEDWLIGCCGVEDNGGGGAGSGAVGDGNGGASAGGSIEEDEEEAIGGKGEDVAIAIGADVVCRRVILCGARGSSSISSDLNKFVSIADNISFGTSSGFLMVDGSREKDDGGTLYFMGYGFVGVPMGCLVMIVV